MSNLDCCLTFGNNIIGSIYSSTHNRKCQTYVQIVWTIMEGIA